jgi:PAS domain S-box-containing protein
MGHGLPPMVPNTALSFILAGFALWLLRDESAGAVRRRLAQACALAITFSAALTMSEYLFDWNPGIDLWLFRESLSAAGTPIPGRPAILTATSFVLIGLALLLVDAKTRHVRRMVEGLAVTALLISLLALIGYACNVPSFYGWRSLYPNTGVALHSVMAFVVLGAGVLCARPDRGLIKVLTSATAGGVVARRLLLAPVIIPLVTGWLRLTGQRVGFYNSEFASWLFAFLNIFVFTIAIWWIATLLYRAETVRQRAQDEIRRLNIELEQRVSDRTAALSRTTGALQESEERARQVLDTALDAVITIDDTGTVTSWSKEAEKIFGWNREEIVGQDLATTIIPPKYREAHKRGLKHYLATGEGPVLNKRIEITALRRDGSEFPIKLAITPVRFGSRMIFSAFVEDITERRTAEEALARERNLLRLLIDNLPACIYVKDLEGRFLVYNAASVRMVGAPSEAAALGKTVFDFFPPEIARLYDADDRQLLATGEPILDREEPTQDHDGNRRWFLTTKLPLRDSRGVAIGLLGISRDITDRKRAEEEIHKLNATLEQRVQERTAQLEAVNKELEAFSYSVSHDLRAPLRHIDGFVNMLRFEAGSSLNETSRRYLEVISAATKQMGALIDDLLLFSRMGRAELSRQSLSMDALVKEALQDLSPEIKGRSITWQIAPLPEVCADRALIKLVWINLLSNAIKYTKHRESAEIRIGSHDRETEIEFYVQDNGAGFDMQYAHKLFGVFQRLHQSEEFEGTGIGLANVRRIITRHGGRTWAEGKVDTGATIYFTVPKPTTT